ncbi:CarboxypepD_reg-like domain-containing protein [Flavobacterium succinicans]|uniref:CarboxypepD_reg-like domain-containing protein n=1 Tax=Flavobacterium succinicans TaxID=29536 RepID=A0A1I4R354_9FLAO|nr:outer membrane beta-barrel protein [Flavobacterium succinicans]SFM46697.1 CarboxypepD_reg-like domain-containing protein [Flavobacterium succinicans]
MQRITGLITILFLCSFPVFSQQSHLSGTLTDGNEKAPVYNSVVALLTPVDSILYKFTRSDKKGNFNFKNVKAGNYILMTSHYQYADYVDPIIIKENENKLETIALKSKIELLREVVIKTGSIRIKGDTTSYRASDFVVSENANVEELLKKLPGIQVDKNGTIKAMGETVQKVLVDGEEFFGDDPGMAVKNLRADAVKEVQVFDKKSDQAEFTGIDDGNTKKTINLKLKEDKKKGYFGKIDGANEPFTAADSRYNTNLMFSSFKGKRKLSAFLLNGNTGQDGLGWEDSEKFGSRDDSFSMNMDDDGNVNYEWAGDNNDDEPYVDSQNGFIKNTNAGVQYSNKWNEKQNLNVSPKFNKQIYTNNNSRFSQTQVGETQLNVDESTVTNVNRSNFKLKAIYDVKLDSVNSLKITANSNFYDTESDDFKKGITTGNGGILKNEQQRAFITNSDKTALSTSILFKHKFAKPRRTFAVNSSWNMLSTNSNNFLKSSNDSYIDGVFDTKNDINQNKIGDRTNENFSASFSYSEPIAKQFSLQFAYQIAYDTGKNNFYTYDFSANTGKYDQLVASLSNEFDQAIITHRPNLKLSYNAKRFNYSVGSGFGFTSFDLFDKTMVKQYKRNYTNFFPSASFSFKYKGNSNLRFKYQGSTIQPTLDQLQPLRNNQDFFNQTLGNPDLKQSFTNKIEIFQHSYDMLTETQFYQGLYFNTTTNAIIYSSIVDPESAKTISKPINSNGNFSGNIYLGYGLKLKKIDVRADFSPFFGFNKTAQSINEKLGSAENLNTGFSIYLNKSKQKQYDITVSNRFTYNRNSTTQNSEIKSFNVNALSLDMGVYFAEKWKLSTDYSLNTRQKTVDFQDNLTNQLWNARLQRTFKNDEFTAYFMVRDILNQNIGIQRNIFGNTISQEQNDRLKRYAMIGFTWNFKNKGEIEKK